MTTAEEPASLLQARREGVLTLSLNRPAKRNAIDIDLAERLLNALTDAEADASVRVICLRGNGPVFCAGRDVSHPPSEQDMALVQAVSRSIVQSRKLVVASVHGWTVGAGIAWAMNADIVLAADNTRFKLPEAALGVPVAGGMMATLPATVGLHRAKALMLLGDTFDAGQAQAWGIVHQVTMADALEQATLDVCHRLAKLAPGLAAEYKRVLNRVGLDRYEQAVQEESGMQARIGRAEGH